MLLCIIKFEIYLYSSTYFFLAVVMYLQTSLHQLFVQQGT